MLDQSVEDHYALLQRRHQKICLLSFPTTKYMEGRGSAATKRHNLSRTPRGRGNELSKQSKQQQQQQ